MISETDADKWIREMCAQFQLVIPVSEHGRQRLTGPQLFALSVDEFLERFPNGGDTLHAQLQLWAIAGNINCLNQIIRGYWL